ncbi:MAG: hypothetical protein AABZ06_04815 [Bdellovibrionota bacterium]
MFAILLLDIIGLSARYSKSSPICEGASPGAGTARYCFLPTLGMPGARIFDVPSVAGKPIGEKMQSSEVMSIIAALRERSKRGISILAAMVLLGWCQVRVKHPWIAANPALTQASSCTFS